MPDPRPPTLGTRSRRLFLRGVGVVLPTVLTLWILWTVGVFVYRTVVEPINAGLRAATLTATQWYKPTDPPSWYEVTDDELHAFRAANNLTARVTDDVIRTRVRREALRDAWDRRWYLEFSGLVLALAGIYVAGVLVGGFLGRLAYAQLESLVSRIPGFKQVYPSVKQVVELVFGDRAMAFSRVVAFQFPRERSWIMAFVTGSGARGIHVIAGEPCVTVFVPTSPTPFTGFTIMAPAKDVRDLPISVDEAIRFMVTGGVVAPGENGEPVLHEAGRKA